MMVHFQCDKETFLYLYRWDKPCLWLTIFSHAEVFYPGLYCNGLCFAACSSRMMVCMFVLCLQMTLV